MKSYDFEYDGAALSDYGYTICNFDSNDMETVENGSQITFNTVPTLGGTKFELTVAKYESCLETTFQICKDLCDNTDLEISVSELRTLMRWLNRRGFHKFKLLDEDSEYSDFYFEGSFNVSRLESEDRIVGLELNLITNRPFALLEPITISLENTSSNGTLSFEDVSDEEGYIYPYTEITITSAGDLAIYNELEDRSTYIANCTAGEVITMDYPVISSSVSSHEIQDDFNWKFLRIANTVSETTNNLTVSIPCTIEMTYSPVVKVGL